MCSSGCLLYWGARETSRGAIIFWYILLELAVTGIEAAAYAYLLPGTDRKDPAVCRHAALYALSANLLSFLGAQIAEWQSQYENVEQEDERSGTLDMNLIAQKLDEWQKASRNDVDRELINSCVAQITPLTNEEYRWVLDFQLTEVQSGNSATCTLDGFMEMARFTISFEEAKAFKASRNQGIRKNEWQDLTVVVGIWSKTQK